MTNKKIVACFFAFLLISSFLTVTAQKKNKSAAINCYNLPPVNLNAKKDTVKTEARLASEELRKSTIPVSPLNKENLSRAILVVEEAIKIDPTNVDAYLGLVELHGLTQRYADVPGDSAEARAWKYLEKAVSLDPNHAEVANMLASRSVAKYDYACAEQLLQRALELKPKNLRAHFNYAQLLGSMGNFEEAFKHAAMSIDADSAARMNNVYNSGRLRYMAHQYDWVLNHYQKFSETYPKANLWLAHFYMGLAYAEKKQFQEALKEQQLATPSWKGDAGAVANLGRAYAQAGYQDTARQILTELIGRNARGEWVVQYQIATVYEALGEVDEAFKWLNKEVDKGGGFGGWVIWLNHDPRWEKLRKDARFKDLVKRAELK